MDRTQLRRERWIRIAACLLTLGILFVVYRLHQMAPFGDASLAREDADIQYLQFYSYLKDVFAGKQDLKYSLTIGLGLSGVPILNYYLQSPFNLLLVFFSRTQLHSFFDITAALKLGLASMTFAYYLQRRFAGRLPHPAVLALSLCYSLMQYSLAQSSNLMWLDGIYLLPLILLGVYDLTHRGRIGLLAGAFALNLIFNWYIAAVNALFSLMVLILELLFREERGPDAPGGGTAFFRWCRAGVRSLLLAAFSFLPMVLYLTRGKGAALDVHLQWDAFLGNALNTLSNYRIWSICQPGTVTWYCGGIALFGLLLFLLVPGISRKKKCAGLIAVLFLNLCYYWQPLFRVFSLMKEPMGHWCRYSYLGSALLLMLTGHALTALMDRDRRWLPVLPAAVLASLALAVTNLMGPGADFARAAVTIGFLLLAALAVPAMDRKRLGWILPCVLLAEMGLNAWGLAGFYGTSGVEQYNRYMTEQGEQIRTIQTSDSDLYRITQTSVRRYEENGRTAAFDEGMALGYASNTAYHSVPDNRHLTMLDALGYRTEAGCMNIVNTTILPADSLLGVKYILSSVPVPGLTLREDLPAANGKRVYENPDAFPMAFVTDASSATGGSSDPFQNANAMIRALTGVEEDVFLPADSRNVPTEQGISVTVSGRGDMPVLYGAFPETGDGEHTILFPDGSRVTTGAWLSPEVLMLSSDGSDTSFLLEGTDAPSMLLYRLDPGALQRAAARTRERSGTLTKTGAGRFAVTAQAEEGDHLYLSIPYSPDFRVRINGETTKASPAGEDNAMMLLPLKAGENTVELSYRVPGLLPGIAVTLLEALILLVIRRRKKT